MEFSLISAQTLQGVNQAFSSVEGYFSSSLSCLETTVPFAKTEQIWHLNQCKNIIGLSKVSNFILYLKYSGNFFYQTHKNKLKKK